LAPRARSAGQYYAAACAYGDGRGCSGLAALRERSKSKDKLEILALYDRACDLDDAAGCLRSGILGQDSKHKAEREAATLDLERACELDDAEASLTGKLVLSAVVDATGAVQKIAVESALGISGGLVGCATETIRRLKFAETSKGAELSLPFVFSTSH
jgi:TPR repeat protein